MWFEKMTGFQEKSPEYVRKHLVLNGTVLKSLVNGVEYSCGSLDIPSLRELRETLSECSPRSKTRTTVREVVANVQDLYIDESNAGALFQVASQFNLLEMVSPSVTPERGVDGYESDFTQGPASAIAAGAATIFRNYFVEVNGRIGQSRDNQLDCLYDLGEKLAESLNISREFLWKMLNGYALVSESGLKRISEKLESATEEEIDELRSLLRIGVHSDVQVTIFNAGHKVSQAFCSALPISYCECANDDLWRQFAKLILEAAYEATFNAAFLNHRRTGNNQLYLTLLGGGAFGNTKTWILNAIRRALRLYETSGLDVIIVSYGASDSDIKQLIKEFDS